MPHNDLESVQSLPPARGGGRRVEEGSSNPSRGDDTESSTQHPKKKRRKQRPCFNCQECRRLKLKCDLQVPCSNCTRRGRTDFCNFTPKNGSADHRGLDSGSESRNPREQFSKERSQDNGDRPNQPLNAPNRPAYDHAPLEVNASGGQADAAAAPPCQPHLNLNDRQPASLSSHPSEANNFDDGTNNRYLGDGENNVSHGTLMLVQDGRSRYLGPTAGSEWLKDSEMREASESPLPTRLPSPAAHQSIEPPRTRDSFLNSTPNAFPFNTSPDRVRTKDLLAELPPRDEAWSLVESHYRYCAWHHDVAPREMFEPSFDRVYSQASGKPNSPQTNAQEIALVFIILAQGTIFNIELPSFDPSVEEWLRLSELALVKGHFLSNNTIPGLQTLHLMAHLHLHLDQGRRGDNAWPLWGLVMRLVQAMGIHRDGGRWNLPADVIEHRRKIFWECNTADIFQAHCFSRPSALNPEHYDTEFPSQPSDFGDAKSYSTARFELAQISSDILNVAMKVRRPSYNVVLELHGRLIDFESALPFYIRCRAALLAMPSRYVQVEKAIEASPEPSRRSMKLSFQQTNLALNTSETIINLHRPYFAKALYQDSTGECSSAYFSSFLTVIERCAIIVAIVADIHARFPAVSTRQWNFWFHVFNSALCLGTLVLRDPGNAMAAFALDKIDSAVNLFHSLTRHGGGSPRSHRNLQWLINLRSRASTSINAVTPPVPRDLTVNVGIQNENSRTGEDVDAFLGWRTRLIERSCQGRPSVSREIVSTTPATPRGSGQPPATDFDSFYDALNAGGASHQTVAQSNAVAPDATDDLLHDFWDPLLLQEFMDPTSHDNQNNWLFQSNAAMNWGGNTDTVGPSGTQTHHSGKDILQQT